jgi:hypothetical protein
MLGRIHVDLRFAVLDALALHDLAALPATCRLWRAYVTQYLAWLLRDQPQLKELVVNAGQPRISWLAGKPTVICAGGYDSSWNGHVDSGMEDDGPGCEQSAEPIACVAPFSSRSNLHNTTSTFGTYVAPFGTYVAPAPSRASLPHMRERRADLALVATSAHTVYALGGRDGVEARSTVECLRMPLWQLKAQGWQDAPPMLHARYGHVAAYVGGHIVVAGGVGNGAAHLPAEMLSVADAVEPRWTAVGSPVYQHRYAASAVLEDRLYVLGGDSLLDAAHDSGCKVESFDPHLGTWVENTSMLRNRFSAAAVAYRGRIIVIGGASEFDHLTAEAYDPREGVWTEIRDFCGSFHTFARLRGHCAAVLNEDTLFLLGGMMPATAGPPESPSRWYQRVHMTDNAPAGASSRAVRTFDLRFLDGGASAQEARLTSIGLMRTPRWCGGSCVVNMA